MSRGSFSLSVLLLSPKTAQSPEKQSSTPVAEVSKGVGPEAEKSSLLKVPNASATDSEKQAYTELLKKNARESNTVFIAKDCALAPTVTRVSRSSIMKIANEDGMPHVIQIGTQRKITIDPNESKEISASGSAQQGFVSITCDDSQLVGYLYYTP